MKKNLVIFSAVALLMFARPTQAAAETDGGAIIADVLIARPACLVATAVGSVFFVLSLPFALASKSVDHTADTLVVQPARATFTRSLGDFDALL